MLPEFTDGGALPAASGFGTGFGHWRRVGEVLAHVGSHCGAGAMEVEALGEFVSQHCKIQGLTVRQNACQEIIGLLGPRGFVITAGGPGDEGGLLGEPPVTQTIELG